MATASVATITPAGQLLGITLQTGWKLVQKLQRVPGGSGSNFGVGYKAERQVGSVTERAFVKAIDFVKALNAADPFVELLKLTTQAVFEREAMELCEERRLSRLIKLKSSEYVNLDPGKNPMNQVLCLVMEDGHGDIRRQITQVGGLPSSVVLHVLEDMALGLAQLHRHGVAHQDVKPSNVITMTDMNVATNNLFKVADLGRVVRKDKLGPYDQMSWPGDKNYAPPERWYGFVPPQWSDAREASDAYMLGSLACFLFSGVTMQALMHRDLAPAMHPKNWSGSFNDSLIQVLRSQQFKIIANDIAPTIHSSVRDGVVSIIKDLVEPDPMRRGDKRARAQAGGPGLERFQPRFKQLRLRAAISEKVNGP
jgi:serine/threonine protein kinase